MRSVTRALNSNSSLGDRSEPQPVSDGIARIEDDAAIGFEAIQNLGEVLLVVIYHSRLGLGCRCYARR